MVLSRIKAYGQLVMFSHTLFSIPFGVIAMLWAADGFPPLRLTILILIALISARTAANALNRVVDKDIDARNPRTSGRHMPKGEVTVTEALVLTLVCLLILAVTAAFISPICFGLLPIPLLLFFIYSFTKRFTWACHLILGAACGLAPVGAWIAVTGEISAVSLVLWGAVTLWVAGFDIIYGAQDVEFDRGEVLHSIPADFGVSKALVVSAVLHTGAVALLMLAGILGGRGLAYFIGMGIITVLLLWEHLLVSPKNLRNVTIASYSINQIVSVVFLLSAGADIFIV